MKDETASFYLKKKIEVRLSPSFCLPIQDSAPILDGMRKNLAGQLPRPNVPSRSNAGHNMPEDSLNHCGLIQMGQAKNIT